MKHFFCFVLALVVLAGCSGAPGLDDMKEDSYTDKE